MTVQISISPLLEKDDSKEGEIEAKDPPNYNLRRKPRRNYQTLNDGVYNVTNSAYPKIDPPKYAWDSFDSDSDDDDVDVISPPILQFHSWCKLQPRYIPPDSIFIHWFKDKYPEMDTLALQSLARKLVNFSNVSNPNVSSDEASTEVNDDQSGPEVLEIVNISDESNATSFVSLPLGQGSPVVQNLRASSPSPPTARRSSTTDALLDLSHEAAPLIPVAPLLQTLSPRRPPVISCPTGTCDEESIANNLLPLDNNVFLEPSADGIDEVPIAINSPEVNRENYPILFNFLETVPSPEVNPVEQQIEEAVPVPPPPDGEDQGRPQRRLRRVDYRSLHKYGRVEENAWLSQLQTRQDGDKEGTLEEMEDREHRGAPE